MLRSSNHRPEAWPLRMAAFLGALVALVGVALTLGSVFADAPDPKATSGQAFVGPVYKVGGVGPDVVRVTLSGEWVWSTFRRNSTYLPDCNPIVSGVGYAVDWGDPGQPGNVVTTLAAPVGTVDVGALAGNARNPADNEVHPTPNEPGTNTFFNDPNVTPPTTASAAIWRSGCGHDSNYAAAGGHPEGAWGAMTVSGSTSTSNISYTRFTCPNDPATWTTAELAKCKGASHVYAVADLAKTITICAIMYDTQGAPANSSPAGGAPTAFRIRAGGVSPAHNDDNGAEKNSSTPLGNTCVPIDPPPPPTNTPTATNTATATGTSTATATATRTSTPTVTATGTLTPAATNTPTPTPTATNTATVTATATDTTITRVLRVNTTVPTVAATSIPTAVNETLALVATPQAPRSQSIVPSIALPNTGSGASDGGVDGWVAFGFIAGGVLLMVPAAVRLRKRDED